MTSPVVNPSDSTPRSRAGALLAGFFALGVIAAVVFTLLPEKPKGPPTPDLSLTNWRLSAQASAAQAARDREKMALVRPGEREEPIAAALGRFNEAELAAGGVPTAPALQAAQADLKRLLDRYANERGVERFHALGLHYREFFIASLGDLLQAVRASGERTSVYLDRHPLAPETQAFRRWGGAFLQHALRAGLVTEDGHLTDGAAHVPGLFFLVRWFHWIQPTTDYTFQLSETELTAFWAWKIEQHAALPLARRFALIPQLERLSPAYPSAYVRGVLLARERRWAQAALQLREWLVAHPEDGRAAENLLYCEAMAAAGSPRDDR